MQTLVSSSGSGASHAQFEDSHSQQTAYHEIQVVLPWN